MTVFSPSFAPAIRTTTMTLSETGSQSTKGAAEAQA